MANQNRGKDGRFISKGLSKAQAIFNFIGEHSGLKMTAKEIKADTPELEKLKAKYPEVWDALKADVEKRQGQNAEEKPWEKLGYRAIYLGKVDGEKVEVPAGIQRKIKYCPDSALWALTILYPEEACINLPAGVFRFIQLYATTEQEARHILAIFEALGLA